jgi:signal transduction histidine kinase
MRKISLRISDNGTGIDSDIQHRGKQGHFGLQTCESVPPASWENSQ